MESFVLSVSCRTAAGKSIVCLVTVQADSIAPAESRRDFLRDVTPISVLYNFPSHEFIREAMA